MRIRTIVAALGVVVLALGLFSATALGGKKKKTTVVVNAGPVLSGKQNVKVGGSLNTATACRGGRSMRLFLTDAGGNVIETVDSATSSRGGNWSLKAKLENPPSGDQRLQVKAKKLSAGKFVCKAGLSNLIAID
jgi:hypothetical protein